MDDGWMRQSGFMDRSWEADTVGDLVRRMPSRSLVTVSGDDSLQEAVHRMKENGLSQLPVLEEDRVVGIVTESDLLGRIVDGRAALDSAIAEVMFRNVATVHENDDTKALLELFETGNVGVVVDEAQSLVGILTKMDLFDHLSTAAPSA
ncbi:MAG: CBS domain-containing protein [Planctomycetota bacterium]